MNSEEYKEINEEKKLKNGLKLVISSRYKHIAGDRCQVTLEAEIDIEVKEEYFRDKAPTGMDFSGVRSLIGDRTSYNYSKTRNFIDEAEKEKIFEELKQQFLENSLDYISSDPFPVKLIKRKYAIAQKEEMIRLQREAYLMNK